MIIKVISKAVRSVFRGVRKVVGWLFKMPDMPDAAAVMVEKQGSDHPIPVVYGNRKIGVIKVHKYVTDLSGGAQNELLHLICVLCEGEIDAIEEVFFDGVSENDQRWRKDKNNPNSAKWFTVHRYLGAANQPASAAAVSGIPNWTIDHKLSGLAYLYIVVQMDKDQSVWRGEPETTARVRGRKIFDPRTNTTAFSTNPAIQLLDYLQNPIYGKGLNLNRLDQSSFIAAANFADETLNSTVIVNGTPTPFTHKRFTGNQVVDTGRSVFSNVQQMLSAIRGSLPIGSGVLRLQLERDTSPVFYFSHGRSEQLNHATITGRIKSSGGSKKDRFNRVVVRFPNAALDFERDEVFYPDSEDPQFSQWLAEDNGVLLEQNFEFNTITNKAEALQMARIIALRSRFQLQCSFTASPAAIVVEPGDVVGITDDTRGWDAKPFRVEQVKLKDDGDVELEFIEHQNAIYPWSGTTYEERTGGTNLGDPTNIPAPTGLFITPDPTFATGGRLSWNTINNAFIRRFRIQLQTGAEVLFTEETAGRSLDLPLLAPGNYSITVFAISTLGTLSPPAVIAFELTQPVPPSDIVFTLANFEIEARPVLAGAGLGTQFEFAIGNADVVRGRGISMVFTGLAHSTEYTVFARTVNALGASAWISRIATTTANAANIVDLIGEDIGNQIFDDVVDQVNANLQQVVADATSDLPTQSQVQQLIDDSIALVNAADTEDPRIQVMHSTLALVSQWDANVKIRRLDFAIAQEGQLRAAAIVELNAANQAVVTQLQQVETNLAGNSSALSSLQGQVNNPSNGLSATFTLAQQAKVTADGNASSITQINNDIFSLGNGLSATFTLASNNQAAIASLNSRVTNAEGDISQAQLTLQSTVNELGQVSSRAFLGVTTVVDGRAVVNGVVVDGATNTLEFRGNVLRLTDTEGNVQLYWDAGRSKWIFMGDIVAATFQTATSGFRAEMSGAGDFPFWYGTGVKNATNGLFYVDKSGNVVTKNQRLINAKLEFIGSTHMRLESAVPFGPNSLISWFGPKINGINWNATESTVIESGILKSNAITFLDSNGQAFFGGSILAGTLRNAAQSTQLAAMASVETGLYGSNGGLITIKCSFSAQRSSGLQAGVCPVGFNPTGTLYLERLVGATWVEVASQTMTGGYSCSQEGSEYISEHTLGGSFTYTDTQQTTAQRNYRLRVSHNTPVVGAGNLATQRLSIISEE